MQLNVGRDGGFSFYFHLTIVAIIGTCATTSRSTSVTITNASESGRMVLCPPDHVVVQICNSAETAACNYTSTLLYTVIVCQAVPSGMLTGTHLQGRIIFAEQSSCGVNAVLTGVCLGDATSSCAIAGGSTLTLTACTKVNPTYSIPSFPTQWSTAMGLYGVDTSEFIGGSPPHDIFSSSDANATVTYCTGGGIAVGVCASSSDPSTCSNFSGASHWLVALQCIQQPDTPSPTTIAPTQSLPPTMQPTLSPVRGNIFPTSAPSFAPTSSPTIVSIAPSEMASSAPTAFPSAFVTATPTLTPTDVLTVGPTRQPTESPSSLPTEVPTTSRPSADPTLAPTASPTAIPSMLPTFDPTSAPVTSIPSSLLTPGPTIVPTTPAPSAVPTFAPFSFVPTQALNTVPNAVETAAPMANPTTTPTVVPSKTSSNAATESGSSTGPDLIIIIAAASAVLLFGLLLLLRKRHTRAKRATPKIGLTPNIPQAIDATALHNVSAQEIDSTMMTSRTTVPNAIYDTVEKPKLAFNTSTTNKYSEAKVCAPEDASTEKKEAAIMLDESGYVDNTAAIQSKIADSEFSEASHTHDSAASSWKSKSAIRKGEIIYSATDVSPTQNSTLLIKDAKHSEEVIYSTTLKQPPQASSLLASSAQGGDDYAEISHEIDASGPQVEILNREEPVLYASIDQMATAEGVKVRPVDASMSSPITLNDHSMI